MLFQKELYVNIIESYDSAFILNIIEFNKALAQKISQAIRNWRRQHSLLVTFQKKSICEYVKPGNFLDTLNRLRF